MPVKAFSIVTSIAMIIIIAIASFLRKLSNSYATMAKKPLFAGLIIALLDAVVAFCITYLMEDDSFLLFWVLCAVFLLMGILTILLTDKYFVQEVDENASRIILAQCFYTIAIMLLIAVLLMISIFFLLNRAFIFYPLMLSVLAFFIPMLFYLAYFSVMQIPLPVYRTWVYPSQTLDPPEDNYNDRLLVIGFLLTKRLNDKKNTFFRAKAPEGISLGELFYHFMNDYNELQSETPIHFIDNSGQPLEWWFRKKRKWFQSDKILDPTISVRENNINENTVIVCEHLKI